MLCYIKMSKSYQYFAKKRNSHYYMEAMSICKHNNPNNYTKCKTCLIRTGRTRQFQRQMQKQINK